MSAPTTTTLKDRTQAAVTAALAKAPLWLSAGGPTLLIRAGSHAAGVALTTSDVDLRGCAIATKASYLGFVHRFERFVCDAPDCDVADLRFFLREACEGQPNALQVLFCEEEDVLVAKPAGRLLRGLRDMFLTRRLLKPYLGYVKGMTTQVQKAAEAVSRSNLEPPPARLADLAKSTMHAVRLSRTVREVLSGDPMRIRRPDADELLQVRALRDVAEMARICAEVEGGVEGLWALSKTSDLPERPDVDRIDRLCVELIEAETR